MSKIAKLIKHIKNGTLRERIAESLRPVLRRRKANLWNRKTQKQSELVKEVFPGVRMHLFRGEILSKAIFMGNFEWQEIQFLSKILHNGDTFIDIGGNIGFYSVIAAKLVGASGKVIAVEPVKKTFDRLNQNIQLNHYQNVQTFQLALSSKNGVLPMNVSQDGYDAWNSLTTPARGETYLVEEVKTQTLDDFIEANKIPGKVKMVKIDVEGWESELAKGATRFFSLAQSPILQVEFNQTALKSAGSSSKQLHDQITACGYSFYVYDGKKNRLTPFIFETEDLDTNLYAIKDIEAVNRLLMS
ncbi:MAG: FkbM family methyltransferase [Anaerolineaceae bacterium]